jgi:hypothetical protein
VWNGRRQTAVSGSQHMISELKLLLRCLQQKFTYKRLCPEGMQSCSCLFSRALYYPYSFKTFSPLRPVNECRHINWKQIP